MQLIRLLALLRQYAGLFDVAAIRKVFEAAKAGDWLAVLTLVLELVAAQAGGPVRVGATAPTEVAAELDRLEADYRATHAA